MRHSFAWHTAPPLWPLSLADGGLATERFGGPALLRFKGDDFMPQLKKTLERRPEDLPAYVARPESWREEKSGWLRADELAAAGALRLYQPVHFRFYMVAASLVCQLPGLPDRRVDAANRERVSFVMRRLAARPGRTLDPFDATTYDELGWFGTQQQGTWRPITRPEAVAEDEERLALAPLSFSFEGRARSLLTGLVPVARRDVYEAGVTAAAAPAPAAQLQADPFANEAVAEASERIGGGLAQIAQPDGLAPPAAAGAEEGRLRAEAKNVFAHVLLDLAEYLETHLEPVWNALDAGSSGLDAAGTRLFDHLDRVVRGRSRRYRQVLREVAQGDARRRLSEGDVDEAFVDGLLGASAGSISRADLRAIAQDLLSGDTLRARLVAALGDPRQRTFQRTAGDAITALAGPHASDEAAQDALLDALLALAEFLRTELAEVWSALTSGQPSSLSSADRALYDLIAGTRLADTDWRALVIDAEAHRADILARRITPAILVVGRGLTAGTIAAAASLAAPVAQAVAAALPTHRLPTPAEAHAAVAAAPPEDAAEVPAFYRVRCVYERPQCEGHHPPVVSEPSTPFQLASFFDPDAPIRPIRIQMPSASLANLRKSPRGVAIAVPKELREQIARARQAGLQSLIDGNIPSAPSFDFGLICTLSIPIITICALILLMIVVNILNMIFHWLPYFILCLPRLGKGK